MFQQRAKTTVRPRDVRARRTDRPWLREQRFALRVLLIGLVLGVLMTQVVLGGQGTHGSWVTVKGGQSLWSLASAHYTQMDPRQAIMNIQAANHLVGDYIYPGEQLLLPSD